MIPSLTGIHFLISYGCSAECDHCFIWGSPRRNAHMTPEQVDGFLDEVVSLGTVTDVCAEGGEPFTQYEVMLHFLRAATERGIKAGALTNASWVRSQEHAKERLAELMDAGLSNLGVSTDEWHQKSVPVERVDTLLEVCDSVGLAAVRMEMSPESVMYRGRAAERLAASAPQRPASELTECPHEQLDAPGRVHLDCFGRVHLCQGLCLAGRGPAACADYDPDSHPIVRELLDGGPYALGRFAEEHGFVMSDRYADACHLCYHARLFLRDIYPDLLGPDQMYGE